MEVSNLDAFPPVDHTSQRPLVEACCGVNADADAADVPPPPLVSRLHASDKQQQIRERFEEKQRDGARRDAIEEKRAKKEVRGERGAGGGWGEGEGGVGAEMCRERGVGGTGEGARKAVWGVNGREGTREEVRGERGRGNAGDGQGKMCGNDGDWREGRA